MPDTSNLDVHYSQYDKNGDIDLAVNEHEAPPEKDVCANQSLFFLWCDNHSLPHASALNAWLSTRPAVDSGNMWDWFRREIAHIAEEAGPMAHARAATSIPLIWIYRLFEHNNLADPALFSDDPSSSALLSELADELAAADALHRREGDVAFEECGAAPEAPPAGGCDAAATARIAEMEEALAGRLAHRVGSKTPRQAEASRRNVRIAFQRNRGAM